MAYSQGILESFRSDGLKINGVISNEEFKRLVNADVKEIRSSADSWVGASGSSLNSKASNGLDLKKIPITVEPAKFRWKGALFGTLVGAVLISSAFSLKTSGITSYLNSLDRIAESCREVLKKIEKNEILISQYQR